MLSAANEPPDPEVGPNVAIVLMDRDSGEMHHVRAGTPAHDASMEWARFHNVDPMTVPFGTVVLRDAYRRYVSYWRFVYDPPEAMPDPAAIVLTPEGNDAEREHIIEQGEAPPLPFPPELTAGR